jgi:hypothetical protein
MCPIPRIEGADPPRISARAYGCCYQVLKFWLSIDTIELYERNMIDELALRLVHG